MDDSYLKAHERAGKLTSFFNDKFVFSYTLPATLT